MPVGKILIIPFSPCNINYRITSMNHTCPLCSGDTDLFYHNKIKTYFICQTCKGISLEKSLLPDSEKEKERYFKHNNDIEDAGYQAFVFPIIEAVTRDFKVSDKGLDFGAGPGPVIKKLLNDKGYNIKLYDPFFHNHPDLLSEKYNYIVCCEVAEHFHHPWQEFDLLKRILAPGGKIYCMTYIYDESIDFSAWSYKNDLTHVFIYQKETFTWIKENIEFSKLAFEKRLTIISK
jgi:SAM-dependent methyltransferase